MTGKNIITINGRTYDAVTGLAVEPSYSPKAIASHEHHTHNPKQHTKHSPHRAFSDITGPAPAHRVAVTTEQAEQHAHHSQVESGAIHSQLQRSQTLNRSALKKPMPLKQLTPVPVRVEADYTQKQAARQEAAAQHHRSPIITKFAPSEHITVTHPMPTKPEHQPERVHSHPVVTSALANRAATVHRVEPQTSAELKEALIRERMAEAQPHVEKKKHRSQPKLATILTSSLAMLLLAGYLTYINLPNISMRVAATRAGIAANYPSYQPDGYHFAGPITYQPGQVNITFQSNTNSNDFVIKQQASSWDSQAVLDNYVTKQSNNYLTYQERGLTIYSFGDHAAWVNGGLLYTIDGNAPLSSDQLLNLATSM